MGGGWGGLRGLQVPQQIQGSTVAVGSWLLPSCMRGRGQRHRIQVQQICVVLRLCKGLARNLPPHGRFQNSSGVGRCTKRVRRLLHDNALCAMNQILDSSSNICSGTGRWHGSGWKLLKASSTSSGTRGAPGACALVAMQLMTAMMKDHVQLT